MGYRAEMGGFAPCPDDNQGWMRCEEQFCEFGKIGPHLLPSPTVWEHDDP